MAIDDEITYGHKVHQVIFMILKITTAATYGFQNIIIDLCNAQINVFLEWCSQNCQT